MTEAMAEKVLSFWFAPASRPCWFESEKGFDREIEERFLSLIEAAARGELEPWAETPRGALALCILLDQFPRNVWRGTPRAFASDAEARRVAGAALAAGHDRKLEADERLFLYLPFEHSEDLADQERSVALFHDLGDAEQLDYAVRHHDIIARFGRFPHRNRVLGRVSTPEEQAFLQQPGSSF
jgi:uncharacterized protein (DUF924 family)